MRLAATEAATVRGTLTVFFEDPFWVAMIELEDESTYAIARHVFGSEPSDAEVLAWVQADYRTVRFTSFPRDAAPSKPKRNPLRTQREARRALERTGVGSRAAEAWKEALSARARARSTEEARRRDEERDQRWQARVEKRKAKHRGH